MGVTGTRTDLNRAKLNVISFMLRISKLLMPELINYKVADNVLLKNI